MASGSLFTLRVPATSANLGPGFDALGMALGIYLQCRFQQADELSIHVKGRDAASIPATAVNLIWQTALTVAGHVGAALPPVRLEIDNDIPLGKGLGSSAAALTAGVVMADRLLQLQWSQERILDEAARIEGHPDNVAACVLGSIVASAIDDEGVARAIRLELPHGLGVAVIVPDFPLATSLARSVLPQTYSRRDVVFNVQRSALLIAALATGRTDAFPMALDDRLHQPYREALIPGLPEILRLRVAGLLGCALSGAGPSVLVFYQRGRADVCEAVRSIFRRHGHEAEVLPASIALSGYLIWKEPA